MSIGKQLGGSASSLLALIDRWVGASPVTPVPPDGYRQSIQRLRRAIGLIGMMLPLVLAIGEMTIVGRATARGSLSAYYHSSIRDLFVASLAAIGVFLMAYRVGPLWNADWVLSTVAGAAALGVALLPCHQPALCSSTLKCPPPTDLQAHFGQGPVATWHGWAAAILLTTLAMLALAFARRDQSKPKADPARRDWPIHLTCGLLIVIAGLWVLMGVSISGLGHVYVGEFLALESFGVSWLVKGRVRGRTGPAGKGPVDSTFAVALSDSAAGRTQA